MNKYTVEGSTLIGWTFEVIANNPAEAEARAKEFWQHNATYEDVRVNGVYDEDGEPS